ncbi:MAG: peptidoglycan editing factor PgeF [Gammaproteobacteria bacterium]
MPDNNHRFGWLPATWNAPHRIHAGTTTRIGGFSSVPYDTFNLGAHVGDDPECVARNRNLLCKKLGLAAAPCWLLQEHGSRVVNLENSSVTLPGDGAFTTCSNQICVVLTADCLPLLLCDRQGSQIAAVHVGWRGYSRNIIAHAISIFSCRPADILAWLGPAISASNYEVGPEVLAACQQVTGNSNAGFSPSRKNRWQADLAALARLQLESCGVRDIHDGNYCTYADPGMFYSYRRDGLTGRMASLIWME